jgi:hypothetical protein
LNILRLKEEKYTKTLTNLFSGLGLFELLGVLVREPVKLPVKLPVMLIEEEFLKMTNENSV